eukprot:GHVR01007831.1.p1 GENE.GHVR01007831.1~~GHVR01007831.1.p1  ORF type:complete len:171 (+),score=28.23 GHVR01007831.1:110-622(+)
MNHNRQQTRTKWRSKWNMDEGKIEKKSKFGPLGANLFIFHLPDEFCNNMLFELFSTIGTVVSHQVHTQISTGRSRGFGFVCFSSVIEAASAIVLLNGAYLMGKRLKVETKKGELFHFKAALSNIAPDELSAHIEVTWIALQTHTQTIDTHTHPYTPVSAHSEPFTTHTDT